MKIYAHLCPKTRRPHSRFITSDTKNGYFTWRSMHIYARKHVAHIQDSLLVTRKTDTSHEDLCTFMPISRWSLHRMRHVSNKTCRGNQTAHFMCNNIFPDNRAFYEIMWINTVHLDRPQMTTWHCACAFACWITKATDTRSEYVIVIAGPRQQRLRERT